MEKVRKIFELLPGNAGEYIRKIFKIAVFGVKNNFVLAGILLIGYCVIAPAVLIAASIDSTIYQEDVWEIIGVYSVIAAYVGGFLISLVMFGFVHKRRERDFYHSMPVKRGQYFIGYLAAGFVMFTVPYLLMCIIVGLMWGAIGMAFSFVLQTLALYIVIYATVLLSIMFSGSLLSSAVTLAFLNTFPVIVTYCSLLTGGNIDTGAYMTRLSPYIYLLTPLTGGFVLYDSFVNQGPFGWVLWVQLAIAVAELVLAAVMYKLRRGETTMAVAFPKTRYILQYGAMFLVALFCTSIFGDWFYYGSGSGVETVILTAILVFSAFVVLNMILEQNFRAAFHRMRHLFIFAGAYVVVLAVIISIVGTLPHWVLPIRTDVIVIDQRHYIVTYDKPGENEDYYSDYGYYGYDGESYYDYPAEVAGNENYRERYHINKDEHYYVVTDPAQVAELTKRLSDYMNDDGNRDIIYEGETGEYYNISVSLYTLKPGEKVKEGTYVYDIHYISSQSYYKYLGDMSVSDKEHFLNGMDLMEMSYRSGW